MSTEVKVAEAIRQTRRTLAEKTWVPRMPKYPGEICVIAAVPDWPNKNPDVRAAFTAVTDVELLACWNDRQSNVGAVLGMTLEALIAELCKPTP